MSVYEKLYPYQRPAVDFVVSRPGAAMFLQQGTGKSWVTMGVIEKLMSPSFTAVVVVPLANIDTTWVKLMVEHLPDDLTICRTWEEFKSSSGARLLLVNYEVLGDRRLKGGRKIRGLIHKLKNRHWSLVVYDESQRLKARGSQQSRDAAKFKDVDHRLILSGTPVEQAPQDLWAQFRFALPDVFGTKWSTFEGRWLRPTGYMGYKLEFRKEKLREFLKLIHPHVLRVTKDEVLDLPPLTFKKCGVSLLGEQARVYRDLEETMITQVDGREVIADMAITQLVRLQQVCGGFVRTNPTADERAATRQGKRPRGAVVYVGEAKLRKLRTILASVERPVVVFCKYLEEIQQIVSDCESRGLSTGTIQGKHRKHRSRTIEAFQRGELDVLVCQIRSGGVGIDLFRANVAIVYSMSHSFIDFDQALSRIHRNGQTRPVTIYLIYILNAVDSDIYTLILSKQTVSEQVLRKRKRPWRS